MSIQPLMYPEPGEPVSSVPYTPAADTRGWLDHITAWADLVPAWMWVVAITALMTLTVITLPFARAQAYKAGKRAAGHTTTRDTKGTALFIAAMVPAVFFWVAVLAGSFRGLAAFGRDTLKWADGWEYLVPLTLDGIAISFGFLAFRAVRAHRSPDRAVHVATGAAVASALINYAHEVGVGGSWVGGGYLALLSILGLLIFHEFLDQFTEGAAYVQRVNPSFGLRWLTWPTNTVCAWIAWRNYPPLPLPAQPTDAQRAWWGSINHAVAHLGKVRRAKRIARHSADLNRGRDTVHRWLAWIPPLRELVATLTAERAEMAEMSARLDKVAADHAAEKARAEAAERAAEDANRRAHAADTARVRAEQLVAAADRKMAAAQAELTAALARLDQMEQRWIDAKQEAAVSARALSSAQAEVSSAHAAVDRAEEEANTLRAALRDTTEKHSAELAEVANRMRAEMAEHEARIRAEVGTVNLSAYRSGGRRKPTGGQRSKTTETPSAPSNAARMTDEEAVEALFSADMNPERRWTHDTVRDMTGAGYGRIPRLLSALAEYHRTPEAEQRRRAAEGHRTEGAENPNGEDAELARTAATVAAG
ncbi:DUF2637 domain-containing protein [Micromonospora sp. FIMYZ51]|uniref:DUF2637 domain-containing protein n=1 Tax=Micromonospora sp. FIMYZ51 TaxID=3051832 RepID=UPI00311F7342